MLNNVMQLKVTCPDCGKQYSKNGIGTHIWRTHGDGQTHNPNIGYIVGSRTAWNKGLVADNDQRVAKYQNTLKSKYNNGEPGFFAGKKHTKKTKKKIAEKLRIAHAEGRAHNIGQSRWNNKPSYPETFFMKVIENEFEDKDYKREVPFHRFSLDFVWEHKKKVIEIDGEQHERFEEQKLRDIEKDKLLLKEGYKLLRVKWKDMYNDTKTYIQITKEFIHT